VLPESSYACVGDIIDVSMQDGFLRCGTHGMFAALLHMHAPRCSCVIIVTCLRFVKLSTRLLYEVTR
jgi:hypothetical protein